MGIIAAVLLLALIVIGMPIAIAMLVSGVVGILGAYGYPSLIYPLGTFPVARVTMQALSVIPLFVLMGQLAAASGIASDAYRLAYTWLGRLRGSLGLVTVASCGLFAATTGSSAAEVAALAPIVIPEMRKYGYDIRLATGSVAASGTLGILIPPSIGLVLYGILTYESIGTLFIAGIIPGVVSMLIYMAMIYARCYINPRLGPVPPAAISWRQRITSLVNGWGIVLVFGVVVGALYTGVATPTEVGALGCFVTLLLQLLAMRRGRSDWAALKAALWETIKICAMIYAFLIGAGVFSLFMTMCGALPALVDVVSGLQVSPIAIVIGLCLMYIPLGMFFDPTSLTIVTIPLAYPIISALGLNGIWFGIIFVKMMEIAVITPPMGINLYIIKGVFPTISLDDIIRGTSWFLAMDVLTVALLIAFPQITLWLPSMIR